MAIEVGDAIMRFFGDSTQLDQAFNQISADSSAKLGPVKEDIREIGSNWDLSAEKAVVAGEEMQEAAQKTEFSMMEAKGSIALVGEEIGVRLPRHVRGFVAELPGIGPALQAAFAPIAILFMAEALVSLTNKATDFIAKMFIFTEAMQKMDEEAKANNKILLDNEARYDSAKTKLEDLGKTAIELGQDKLKDLNEKIEANAKAFYNAEQTMGAYRLGLDGITKEQAEVLFGAKQYAKR